MMRTLAKVVLACYPKVWRQRYGEEVADLVAARPVRARTVLDLAGGAADAWLHRRHIPGANPIRIPLPLLLPVAGYGLLNLWNPGVRDMTSLNGVWAQAASLGPIAEQLAKAATSLFIAAAAMGVLSVVPLLLTSLAASWRPSAGAVTRGRARGVVATAPLLALPIWGFCAMYYGMTFEDLGFPVGPLGHAMLGGFMGPIVLALVLPLPSIAAKAPALVPDVRASGNTLAVAAILNAIGWLAIGVLLAMGLTQASPRFLIAMAASVLVSIGMTALVARSALRQGRATVGELSLA
ncbi:hypothetical protein [Nonomuraea sp. NPDC049709]|uniref:hypothetical protein n=1 Tax=Nonomuraea sp. NPDC049709 TaxID=3154736 RepID=UPI0034239662